ncbi:MAG: GldG family protein [Lachnospiraceae bacterium]|nr:GldG family protein [Lachnospiraceae bacterium]
MEKHNTKSRHLKSGSYSALITVIVIAVIIVVNLMVNALPATVTKFDFTEQQTFTLSEQTKQMVKGLKEDVTIYVIAQKENESQSLLSLLEKYQALSSNLKVEVKDPAVYPAFTSQYTEETLTDNSLIVVSGEQSRVVTFIEMYDKLGYNEQDNSLQLTSESIFVGEDMITSAIDYVTAESLPKLYIMTGHGEQPIGSFASEIQRENISNTTLNLAREGRVPEDADCILMEAPTSDISAAEAQALSDYLKKGGKFFYVSYFAKNATPNLDGLLKEYGIQVADGFVCEGAGNYYGSYPAWVSPVYGSHEIVNPLAKAQMQMILTIPQHIELLEDRADSITVTPLLRTSSSAYLKQVNAETMEKQAGDKNGVMNLAVAVEKNDTKIIVATTYDLFSEQSNEQVSGGNYDFLLNSIGYLCEHESMVAIRGKQVYSNSLTVTSGHTMLWIFVLMIIIPLVCLIAGLVLWARRRKR